MEIVLPALRLRSDSMVNDAELARRIAGRDQAAFDLLMRHHNGALYRVARAILKNDLDAEDALQEAYLAAYRHITDYRAKSKLSTWLTRIVVNQALAKRRRRHRDRVIVPFNNQSTGEWHPEESTNLTEPQESPEQTTARAEMRRLLERKIDDLPLVFRAVFILREVEELSSAEAAQCLSIQEATVRSRLFRARGLLRESLALELDMAAADVFQFGGERCDRIVASVLERLRGTGNGTSVRGI